jgi:hypothetical protein
MTHHSTVALPGNPDMSQYEEARVHDPRAIAARGFTCILEHETENQECFYISEYSLHPSILLQY